MNTFQKYYNAVNFLESLDNLPLKGDYMIDKDHADFYLKRMDYFLMLIGHPEENMKFIHIAGTSGKGTVTNMIHEILYCANERVGSFTSPYTVTSIEKIKYKDKYISPDEFADIVDYLKPYIDKAYLLCPYGRPSYFEIFLAIAFLYFKKKKCEWVVLEVGLGGRYDATNIIKKPIVTAITTIDYDHTDILGKTLHEIAYDKAGIIKKGSTFFTCEYKKDILNLFREICIKNKVNFIHPVNLSKDYRDNNKILAREITKYIGIKDKYIEQGLKKAHLMCRFEIVQDKPLVILDGSHNRSKIKAVLYDLDKIKFRKLYLIIGISNNKDHISILKQIIPLADYISFTRFQNKSRKCAHPKELLKKSKKLMKKNIKYTITLDPYKALSDILKLANDDDVVLVTGSFYLVGELRKNWFSEESILKNRSSSFL